MGVVRTDNTGARSGFTILARQPGIAQCVEADPLDGVDLEIDVPWIGKEVAITRQLSFHLKMLQRDRRQAERFHVPVSLHGIVEEQPKILDKGEWSGVLACEEYAGDISFVRCGQRLQNIGFRRC